MKTELQHRILILLSLIENGGAGRKKEILDYIDENDYILLNERDRRILDNRPEECWRNALAFARQHLKQEGYMLSETRDRWEISLDGFDYFIKLISKIDDSAKEYEYLSEECLRKLARYTIVYSTNINSDIEDKRTEKIIETKRRIGQNILRKELLDDKGCCELCNIDIHSLLVCSHIKPWSKSDNSERLDSENSLLLCSLHDKLFDKGYISFDEEGRILISSELISYKIEDYLLDGNLKLDLNNRKKQYMKWHRKEIFLR